MINYGKCTDCGKCKNVCPSGVFEETGGFIKVEDPLKCNKNCYACQKSCQENAIDFFGESGKTINLSCCRDTENE